ncbi:peptidase U32 [Caldalkalibacillus thermarum TA2.A1]|uniref:Peptidase U32 n=1 Tax=Caldalkalibacillus thermarum (strain TA2.A1) TaxID=986075 RepID=F5L7I1_CALTT|nr:U32 family peptidase [Caldalkalibacillus thermarum]EGL82695.1 peptidase U32 [Caldalkalibacillus thermarum TA2.A1]QZT33761.1 U32 family peptidase [Caldalkalibacillus thermarum TA2.A1]
MAIKTEVDLRVNGQAKAPLKKPELLAPAGNLEKLQFAVRYGADAVYIGGQQYGLRAKAGNFTFEDMAKGVDFASRYGAKVYVAANIIAHNEDLAGVRDYFKKLQEIGVDACIVADPALIELGRDAAPDLEMHISTQASITNWKAVQFWAQEGIPRVVLAREVSLEEIKEIKRNVDIEIEAFIHGAMCISYSGRCVLSNHMTARDANRGGCAQSCRWPYELYGEKRISVDGDPFTMSSKDLSMVEHVPLLIDAGVDSLKIEGRMKSIHYIATVCNVYRQIIDEYCEDPENFRLKEEWVDEIWKAAQRSLTTAFYFGTPTEKDQLFGKPEKIPKYDFAALVLDYNPDTQIATLQQRNNFGVGDEVEFFGPNFVRFKQKVTAMWDEEDEPLDRAPHPMMTVKMKVDQPVRPYDMMRKRK